MEQNQQRAESFVFLNGSIVPAGAAAISVFDAGLLHGASTFTTMLAHNGVVFRLDRHLDRLLDTVALLGMRTTATRQSLGQACRAVLDANGLAEARMRITLTPGSVRPGLPHEQGGSPTILVTADPLPPAPTEWYTRGITVVVSTFKQVAGDVTFGYKTGCYMPRILARQEAAAKGADEALWFNTDNYLAESCFNNVFLVSGGKVMTPPRDTPVLPGIVRGAVLELCGELGIPSDAETPLTIDDLLAAGEVFLTGSTSGIRPVVRVERHAVGQERPGAVTARLMEAYGGLLERECK